MGECSIGAGPNTTLSGAGTPASPWSIADAGGAWSTTLPAPVFSSGVTVGDGSITARWRVRRSSPGVLAMDYTGLFQLGTSSAITGPVTLVIPNSRLAVGLQEQAQILYLDNITPFAGWWASTDGGAGLTLREMPGGLLSATVPFTWVTSDALRWGIRDLLVAG